MRRIVFHVDFDYFYAQCEEIRNPELRAKPVCVCVYSDRGNDSGAIATANYTARKYGAKSGMPIRVAKAKLRQRKDAVFLPTDFDHYSRVSEAAMGVMRKRADIFEYVGKDEAYMDVTQKTRESYERAVHVAQQLKNEIREAVRITCSVGISPNKLISKIASDFNKPDGLTVVPPGKVSEFLNPLKVRDIPGVGRKAENVLSNMKIETIGQLRDLDIFELNRRFGRKVAAYVHNAARGIDEEPVAEREASVQFSKISTLKHDSKEFEFLHQNLEHICKELHYTVQKSERLFKSVGVHFVNFDMSVRSKSRALKNPTNGIDELQEAATALLKEALADQVKEVRRLGVRVSDLSESRGQKSLDSYF